VGTLTSTPLVIPNAAPFIAAEESQSHRLRSASHICGAPANAGDFDLAGRPILAYLATVGIATASPLSFRTPRSSSRRRNLSLIGRRAPANGADFDFAGRPILAYLARVGIPTPPCHSERRASHRGGGISVSSVVERQPTRRILTSPVGPSSRTLQGWESQLPLSFRTPRLSSRRKNLSLIGRRAPANATDFDFSGRPVLVYFATVGIATASPLSFRTPRSSSRRRNLSLIGCGAPAKADLDRDGRAPERIAQGVHPQIGSKSARVDGEDEAEARRNIPQRHASAKLDKLGRGQGRK